ncbi:SDR family NAD(P)-dependent oxidoreductase [Desertimonas flava]|jgi:NAD(P)-dependent dehydrogenase (short-subunit alcohol dehydrogenase family)|uniref:SDR family NAD(P)-dependent oxidoreductase n=1 Tax=Desertimonas flava TaxID=2064846 RepID=UPI000E343319|nr:SDR family oxidoreductase [Desertimonas flava]
MNDPVALDAAEPVDPGEALDGKVAIVTGASGDDDGLTNGRAAAILLGRAGAAVVCVGRRSGPAERTAEMIEADGGSAIAVAADVADDDDCARVVHAAIDAYGRLDLLDNNVGIPFTGSVVSAPTEAWTQSWQVNVESMVSMSRHAIPAMCRTAGGGAIVNISSMRALRPIDEAPYATTKGAVISLTKAMAVAHGRDGIRVNCVVIGPVFTSSPLGRSMTAEQRERRRTASLLGIEGTSWDTANAVRFLLSERARFITGQVLAVDGGVALTSAAR